LEEYLSNVRKGATATGSKLYRPPYGLMSWKQYRQLSREYRLIMWDVLAGDFDEKLNATQCFKRVKSQARPGSIIVLHDSAKARDRMQETLDKVLRYFTARGYSFKPLAERYS
ncbi:MAG: polysaccharide deacetylase family protein, partial [Flavobacteriales bacterium]